jgi:mono/diheme cytochrome c family protein
VKQALAAPACPPLSASNSPLAVKRSVGRAFDGAASAEQRSRTGCDYPVEGFGSPLHHRSGTCGRGHRFRLEDRATNRDRGNSAQGPRLSSAAPPGRRMQAAAERASAHAADVARGKEAIERVGCASCHTIPGVRWPKGKAAPKLAGMARRALIAGRLPNEPELLAAVRPQCPALVPGTTMPAMPLSEQESRDVRSLSLRAR